MQVIKNNRHQLYGFIDDDTIIILLQSTNIMRTVNFVRENLRLETLKLIESTVCGFENKTLVKYYDIDLVDLWRHQIASQLLVCVDIKLPAIMMMLMDQLLMLRGICNHSEMMLVFQMILLVLCSFLLNLMCVSVRLFYVR